MNMMVIGLALCGVAEHGVRKPKKLRDRGSDTFQLPWLSTPKYPNDQDNGRDDEGYYTPIKKLHNVRNFEYSIKNKKK